jgi:hypothetical protein
VDGVDGADGTSCTVVDNGATKTINCDDGSTATVTDGVDGVDGVSCTVVDGGNGVKTISCTDGSTVTVSDGLPGHSTVMLAAEMPEVLTLTVTNATIGAVSDGCTRCDGAGRGAIGLRAAATGGHLRFKWPSSTWPPTTRGHGRTTSIARPPAARSPSRSSRASATARSSIAATARTPPSSSISRPDRRGHAAPVPIEPDLTHRVGVQMSGTINARALPPYNAIFDFVPAGGAVVGMREVDNTESCNECHGELRAHGSRYEMKYCVTCHTPGTSDPAALAQANPNTGGTANLGPMIHGIHSANMRKARLAPAYYLAGDWSEVTYPQGIESCRKCHDGADPATPQGDNWKTNEGDLRWPPRGRRHQHRRARRWPPGQRRDAPLLAAAIEATTRAANNTPHNPGVPAPLRHHLRGSSASASASTRRSSSSASSVTVSAST